MRTTNTEDFDATGKYYLFFHNFLDIIWFHQELFSLERKMIKVFPVPHDHTMEYKGLFNPQDATFVQIVRKDIMDE